MSVPELVSHELVPASYSRRSVGSPSAPVPVPTLPLMPSLSLRRLLMLECGDLVKVERDGEWRAGTVRGVQNAVTPERSRAFGDLSGRLGRWYWVWYHVPEGAVPVVSGTYVGWFHEDDVQVPFSDEPQ